MQFCKEESAGRAECGRGGKACGDQHWSPLQSISTEDCERQSQEGGRGTKREEPLNTVSEEAE